MKREYLWCAAVAITTPLLFLGQSSGLLPEGWWFIPWGLSLVMFGLPHGAIDHEVVLKLWRPQPPPGSALISTLMAYISLSFLVLGSWWIAPYAVFLGFILLTWMHWGLADLWWSWRRDPGYFSSGFHRGIFTLWRGALPMLIPLAFDPALYRHTAEATCQLFLRQSSDFSWMESSYVRISALVFTLNLGLIDFFINKATSKTRYLNLLEGLSLLFFFSLIPALVSVGYYFAFWHGLRHVLRLQEEEKLSWTGFALHALPATLGALALLAGLAYFVPHTAGNWSLLGLYLALIAALTVPHALVVTWLDYRQGLYKIHL